MARTSSSVTPGDSSVVPGAAARIAASAAAVDRGVLADLERGEVEPERPDLPAQLGDLAAGDAVETVGHERVGDLGQLGLELGGRAVASGQRRRLADERGPRPAQPLGDEPEPLAVRLVGEAPAELAVGLGQVLGVARETRGERPRDPVRRRRRGDRLHQPRRDRLVAAQDVVGVDPQRPESVISAVTPGLPSRSPPIQLPGRRNGPTRGGRVPVRPVSDGRPGARPVGGSRAASSARYSRGMTVNSVASKKAIAVRTSSSGVGLTMRRSDVRHSSVISSRSRRRTSRSSDGVSRGSSSRASRTAQRRRATSVVRRRASVGWAVRTGPDREPRDERVELGVGPPQPAQAGDGVGHRVVEDAVARRALAPAQRPDPTARLGQVDQPEVERERPDDGLGVTEIERPQVLVEPRPLRRVVVAAEGDGPAPDPLDGGEQLRARPAPR